MQLVVVAGLGLIITLMLSGGEEAATLGRDTVFSAVMITCNGVVGLCLLLGPIRRRVLEFPDRGVERRTRRRDRAGDPEFVPVGTDAPDEHAPAPSGRAAVLSLGLLALARLGRRLAKTSSPTIKEGVIAVGAPLSWSAWPLPCSCCRR